MKMAVYQQAKAMVQMDLADCFRNATNRDHVQLINMSVELEKPVLIGLSNVHTIIKPFMPGDDVHSYESLLDISLNVVDLQNMREHNVKDPKHIPPSVFRVRFDIPIDLVLKIYAHIKARDHGELRSKIAHLEENDVPFNEAIYKAAFRAFQKVLLSSDGELSFHLGETTQYSVDPDDPDPPEWKLLDP